MSLRSSPRSAVLGRIVGALTVSTSFELRTVLQELLDRLIGWWHGH